MFDWNDLRHFLAVARHGSTIQAAKSLRMNQSTVQRRIAALERQLGHRLFERRPEGYRLTRLGEVACRNGDGRSGARSRQG
ncbi:MAG: LysR family transcriptional regulator [Bradyrhizobiaceae bacterium]|nr:LysR family transcriptional regulator [Bradyrhizobiaceae bacterium]